MPEQRDVADDERVHGRLEAGSRRSGRWPPPPRRSGGSAGRRPGSARPRSPRPRPTARDRGSVRGRHQVVPADDVGGTQSEQVVALSVPCRYWPPPRSRGRPAGPPPCCPRRPRPRSPAPGRRPARSPWCSSRWSERAAVNPAVPMVAACRGSRPSGRGTTHSAGTRAQLREPAVVGHPEVVAVDDDRRRRRRTAGPVEAATVPTRSTPGTRGDDAGHPVARAGHHPVLVVDRRPVDVDEHLAGRQVVEGEGPHARLDASSSDARSPRRPENGPGRRPRPGRRREPGEEVAVIAGTVLIP